MAWRKKAADGLREGLKDGSLEAIAADMEMTKAKEDKARIDDARQRARDLLLEAAETGDLERALTSVEDEARKGPHAVNQAEKGPREVNQDTLERLPPLAAHEMALVDGVLEKLRETLIELQCTPTNVALFYQELFLWGDERAAKRHIELAFPGRNVTWGIDEPYDWYLLYQICLYEQPVWTKPLTKVAISKQPVTAKDVRNHESNLRKVYNKFSGSNGAMDAEDVHQFFAEAALLDGNADAPRILSDFERRRKPGPVFFPEIVELCNNLISGALRRHANPNFSTLPDIHPKRAYAPPSVGQVFLGNTGAGWEQNPRKFTLPKLSSPRKPTTFSGVLPRL